MRVVILERTVISASYTAPTKLTLKIHTYVVSLVLKAYWEAEEGGEKIHRNDWGLKKMFYSDGLKSLICYTYWKRRLRTDLITKDKYLHEKKPPLDSTRYYNLVGKYLIRTIGGSWGQANSNEDEAMKHDFFCEKVAD